MAPAVWRRFFVAALLAAPLAAPVTKPDGCPEERWTGKCSGTATCESLAIAGLICGDQDGGVGIIPGCKSACAEPCCITTTTTTETTTSQTATTHTATSSATATSVTATRTATTTATSQTATLTGSTVTRTATTSVTTATATGTTTVTTVTMTTIAETTAGTTAVETTAASSEGPFRRLVVRLEVTGVKDETRYITLRRISTAYREAMEDVTGLGKEKVDLQMVPTAPGNLTVSYILNVPEADASSSMEKVKQSLKKETASSFSAKLQEHIDALVGHGHYTQQVVSLDFAEDGALGVSATEKPRVSIWIAGAVAVTAWLGGEIF